MLNDRDEKHEGHEEESEYHFSDDDLHYEVEPEKPPTTTTPTKETFLNRIYKSKRIIISGVVFLLLIFVVYKMIVPSSAPPSTEIATVAPVATPQAQAPALIKTQPAAQPAPPPPAVAAQVQPVIPIKQPTINVPQPPTVTPKVISQPVAGPTPEQIAQQPVVMPQQMGGQPAMPQQPVATPPAAPQQPMAGQPVIPQQMAGQPTMPQQQPTMIAPVSSPTPVQAQMTPILAAQVPRGVDATIAAMTAANEKFVAQLHQEYAQKVNEFDAQNKNLGDKVQALTSRMSNMESQLNQLIQALTGKSPMATNPEPESAPQKRIPYNVQAIIPGRAWLRGDNGETLTVAEGDTIKDLGRVTKIDPYDGIVEINTGGKLLSLSYGSGG